MFKVDLHTHSDASPDGGITAVQYRRTLDSGLLDAIAVTDHNSIDVALQLRHDIGERIIVGEEIMSSAGEIVGLFLSEPVKPGMTPIETIQAIQEQDGIVYIPHPFETMRKGIHPSVLEELSDHIDIVEIYNGRAFAQNRSEQAVVWARLNHKLGAASSDAHGFHGLGRTYTQLKELPRRNNILNLFKSAVPIAERPSMRALLYPKYHKLKRKLSR